VEGKEYFSLFMSSRNRVWGPSSLLFYRYGECFP